jgi:hypothetical protein
LPITGLRSSDKKWREESDIMAIDWEKIRTEYMTTATSYRKLAEKHGVNYSALGARARAEGWVEQRTQYQHETHTKP